ncbi:MAG: DUF4340 domain-containing protein [Myxococcales bacterium]|nr:DUF4340 domain-containing protein [Myxococcales bacterium]
MSQIKKSLLGLLALLVVAGAVGGIAFWTRKDEAAKTEAKEKSEKIFEFDKAHARSLRLEKDGKLVAAVSKDDKGWKVDEPIKAEADDGMVDSLLGSLTSLKQKKDLGEEKDLKAYGLDAPRSSLTVELDDGKEQGLLLGVDNSFDNTLYVKKTGDATVRIVDGYNKNMFDKSLLDLRDKKVAHLDDSADVKRVDVTGVKTPYVLEKDGSGWKVGGAAADSAAADRVVSAVKQLRATAVAAETAATAAQFGLDKPKAVAKLSVTSGKDTFTRTVVFGQKDSKTLARRDDSPVIYEVDASILKDLEKEPFDLQDKTLVKAERDQIRKFVFESPSGKVEVTRTKLTPPDGGFPDEKYEVVGHGPAKKWKMSSASYSMTSLKAAAFDGPVPRDLKKYGFDKTATLLGENDKVLARIRLGAEKDGKRYALADGVDKLARVEKATVDDWPWKLADALDQPPPGSPDAGVQASKP